MIQLILKSLDEGERLVGKSAIETKEIQRATFEYDCDAYRVTLVIQGNKAAVRTILNNIGGHRIGSIIEASFKQSSQQRLE